ncbi:MULTISPECIES: resolvase [unclassified Heyndrickxia]|uniref:resolvase n=1 Tax=unclassified Heyndrickxia TaxID=2837518 RepID=UPI0030FCB53A
MDELQNELLRLANSKADYNNVADEIYRLRELKQNALVENAEREGRRQRIAEMTDFLSEQDCKVEEYDEQLVRRLIERITVFDDKMTIEFKSSVKIDLLNVNTLWPPAED